MMCKQHVFWLSLTENPIVYNRQLLTVLRWHWAAPDFLSLPHTLQQGLIFCMVFAKCVLLRGWRTFIVLCLTHLPNLIKFGVLVQNILSRRDHRSGTYCLSLKCAIMLCVMLISWDLPLLALGLVTRHWTTHFWIVSDAEYMFGHSNFCILRKVHPLFFCLLHFRKWNQSFMFSQRAQIPRLTSAPQGRCLFHPNLHQKKKTSTWVYIFPRSWSVLSWKSRKCHVKIFNEYYWIYIYILLKKIDIYYLIYILLKNPTAKSNFANKRGLINLPRFVIQLNAWLS